MHFVARKSHSDTIAARGLSPERRPFKALFLCRRSSQRLVRARWQLLSSEQRPIRGLSATSFTASKVRSAANSPCSAGGMREASSFTRRHGWAGQSSPAVRGVLASAAFDVGMVSSEAGAAHRAPRPDLGTEVVRVADNFSPSAHRVADSFLIRERSLSSYCEVGV